MSLIGREGMSTGGVRRMAQELLALSDGDVVAAVNLYLGSDGEAAGGWLSVVFPSRRF